jgi:uncharacterized protein
MITILSPAKTLNMGKDGICKLHNQPIFIEEALELIEELRKYSPPEMEGLLKINEELAEVNFMRHAMWKKNHNQLNSKQAILAYHGAVYQGLRAETLDEEQLAFAQQHVRILSALYGVLKPLDLIQPYRLEMGLKLNNSKGKDLYCFWKDTITEYLNDDIMKQSEQTLINLASNEYFSVIKKGDFRGNIITPVFKEYKQGTYKNVTIYAKRARGLMTRYIVENYIDNPEKLKGFEEEGYQYCEGYSTDNEWIFIR